MEEIHAWQLNNEIRKREKAEAKEKQRKIRRFGKHKKSTGIIQALLKNVNRKASKSFNKKFTQPKRKIITHKTIIKVQYPKQTNTQKNIKQDIFFK